MSANRRVVFGASLLGIGTVCFVLMLAPSGESRIVLRMVDRHEAGNGNWIGTFVITNGSDRMVPTFARMSSAGKRGPTDGEPVCWVEPDTVSLGSWQPTWVEYGRILWPTSSWRFQTVIKPTNAPVRLVLTYGLARGRWPRLVENCLEKYLSGVLLATHTAIAKVCDLRASGQPGGWTEREAAVQLRDKSDASDGCPQSLTLNVRQWTKLNIRCSFPSELKTATDFDESASFQPNLSIDAPARR